MNPEMDILIVRHLTGENSVEEEAILHRWIESSPENESYFREMLNTWDLSGSSHFSSRFDPEESLQNLRKKLGFEKPAIRIHYLYKYAAAAVILIAITIGTIWVNRIYRNPAQLIVQITTGDSSGYVRLPDGSEVWLNRHSSLNYPPGFAKDKRHVELTGEAFFQVKHMENQPFEVLTSNSIVRVLGTSFDVRALKGTSTTQVLVETGRVRLSSSHQQKITTVLEHGELGNMNHVLGTIDVNSSPDPNFMSWRTHRLTFRNNTLSEVSKALKETYGIQLIMKGDSVSNLRFTARYNEQELLDNILETIAISFNLKISKISDQQYLVTFNK